MLNLLFFISFQFAMANAVEDPVLLAAKLVGDGNYSRAQSIVSTIDVEDLGEHVATYYTTIGLISLQQGYYSEALSYFEEAKRNVEEGKEGPSTVTLALYIAQCFYMLEEYTTALTTLQEADQERLETLILQSKSTLKLQKWEECWSFVHRAKQLHPHSLEIWEIEFSMYIQLKLEQRIADTIAQFIETQVVPEETYLKLSREMIDASLYDSASTLLQLGRYQFYSEPLWAASAYVEILLENWLVAGDLLAVLSQSDPKYALEAATMYQKGDDISKALLYNSLALDSEEKVKQRFSIFIASKRYEQAIALEQRLQQWKLIEDENIRYGMAYAFYFVEEDTKSLQYLKGISSPKLFDQSLALRRAVEQRQENKK